MNPPTSTSGLSEPQRAMLQRSAAPRGAFVRRGQASTAKVLSRLGLVRYYSPYAGASKVKITDAGRTLLDA